MMQSETSAKLQIVPDIVAKILRGRGMSDEQIRPFLFPDYDEHLHDPFLMTGMEQAVGRILQAARGGEHVVVYGDYDIDGMTATTIMIEGLAEHGIDAASYIPDRFEEGYGINEAALRSLRAAGADLVISVDCGITSVHEAAVARTIGLDLIITDHHSPPEILPEAVAVVNPKQAGDLYPFKDLCGAGVAFKVIQALQQRTGKPAAGQEKWLLDLVALGTVCDVVDLVDENRVLASYGLKVLRQTRRPGIVALAAVAGVNARELTAYHLGYVLGPRLNAAGRLEHASQALELLQTSDVDRAAVIASELDVLNRRRRDEQVTAFTAALEQGAAYADDPVLVVADAGWSHGIVGIVASKLVEAYGKPVLVAQIMGEQTKGSARSVGTFNMVEALRANAELFTKFGGHYYAAGFTLPTTRLDELRRGLCAYYESIGATSEAKDAATDLRLDGLTEVNWETQSALGLLEPHGAGNPAPRLVIDGLTLAKASTVGAGQKHLKLGLRHGATQIDGIGFGLGAQQEHLRANMPVRVTARLDVNEWRGQKSLQLIVSELSYG